MILKKLLDRLGDAAVVLHRKGNTEVYKTTSVLVMSNGKVPDTAILSCNGEACKIKLEDETMTLSEFSGETLRKRIKEIKRNERYTFKKLNIL